MTSSSFFFPACAWASSSFFGFLWSALFLEEVEGDGKRERKLCFLFVKKKETILVNFILIFSKISFYQVFPCLSLLCSLSVLSASSASSRVSSPRVVETAVMESSPRQKAPSAAAGGLGGASPSSPLSSPPSKVVLLDDDDDDKDDDGSGAGARPRETTLAAFIDTRDSTSLPLCVSRKRERGSSAVVQPPRSRSWTPPLLLSLSPLLPPPLVAPPPPLCLPQLPAPAFPPFLLASGANKKACQTS